MGIEPLGGAPTHDATRILLVDDDALVRSIFLEYLHSFGFRHIIVATGGQQALKIIQDKKVDIDLVLSDWEMPKINGLALLRAVRVSGFRDECKFMMITSQASRERVKIKDAQRLRVDGYLLKPFQGGVLRQKIWQVMGWEKPNEQKKAG